MLGEGPELTHEVSEVKLMGGSVATAVLSAFCQFDELASSQDMLEFIPILIKVCEISHWHYEDITQCSSG